MAGASVSVPPTSDRGALAARLAELFVGELFAGAGAPIPTCVTMPSRTVTLSGAGKVPVAPVFCVSLGMGLRRGVRLIIMHCTFCGVDAVQCH